MAKRKKSSGKAARVILALLGIGLLLWNANTVGLYLLGDVATAYDIVLSQSGTRGDSDVGTEYRFTVSYKYSVNGTEYDGVDTGLRASKLGPKVDGTVHYYPFAPRISSLSAEAAASPGMLLLCGFSLALILFAVIPRKRAKDKASGRKKSDKAAQPVPERVTMAWLMEHDEGHDDSLEEYYQEGWAEGDPSWKCSCGKWNTEDLCESCGRPRQNQ